MLWYWLQLDIKTLINIGFVDKEISKILSCEQFWLNKFDYDQLPILSEPLFQEYSKITKCKDTTKKIIAIAHTEYEYNTKRRKFYVNIGDKNIYSIIIEEHIESVKKNNTQKTWSI